MTKQHTGDPPPYPGFGPNWYSGPLYYTPVPVGRICPPGANKECERPDCPRRNYLSESMFVALPTEIHEQIDKLVDGAIAKCPESIIARADLRAQLVRYFCDWNHLPTAENISIKKAMFAIANPGLRVG